jgi:hypothetical protein
VDEVAGAAIRSNVSEIFAGDCRAANTGQKQVRLSLERRRAPDLLPYPPFAGFSTSSEKDFQIIGECSLSGACHIRRMRVLGLRPRKLFVILELAEMNRGIALCRVERSLELVEVRRIGVCEICHDPEPRAPVNDIAGAIDVDGVSSAAVRPRRAPW